MPSSDEESTSKIVSIPTNAELFNIKGWDGIEERCLISPIKLVIDKHITQYYTINVAEASKKLKQVGSLLQLAYGSSKSFPCNVLVVKVLSRYQDLIKDSVITSSTFVEVVLKALKFIKLSMVMAEKGKCDKALTFLVKCESLAHRMVEESDKLVVMADELSKLSYDALETAVKDQNLTEKEKREIREKARQYAEEQAKFQTQCEDLNIGIQEQREEEEKYRKEAEKHEKRGLIGHIPIVTIFTGSMGSKAYKQAERARDKEDAAIKQRKAMQQTLREANAELSKTVKQLQNSVEEEDELQKSIAALEITIKTMARVKTIFANVKAFWTGVGKHCKSLTEKTEIAQELTDFKEEFIEEVKEFGYSWLALGKINLEAANCIRSVDSSVDAIMCDLPSKEESQRLVKDLSDQILHGIELEEKMLMVESKEE